MREGLAREQWESFLPFKVQGKLPDGKQVVAYDAAAQATLGFTLFFSMMSSIFGIGNILEEKESGTWNRLLLSSLSKTQIYLGNLGYIYLVGLLQTGLLLLAGYYLFGVDVFGVDLGENLVGVFLVLSCFILSTAALGLAISGLAHNFKRLQSIAPMVTVSAAMLGGLFWPLEVVHSKPLLALAKVMPTFWGMEGLRALVVLDKGLEAVLLPLAVLVLMTVLLMGIGITLQEKT